MGAGKTREGAFNLIFLAFPLPSLPPLSALSVQTGRASTVGHSESSFSFHFSPYPPHLHPDPFLIPPSHPTPFSIPQLQGLPLRASVLTWSSCALVLGLGLDLSRQVGLQLQRGDQPDLGARGHHEGYSKGHGSRNPSRNPGPLNGEGGGWWGKGEGANRKRR